MEQEKIDVLEEHLPYELDMLEEAMIAWRSLPKPPDDDNNQDWLKRMNVIEVFWVHARVLQEFFKNPSSSGAAVADDFTVPETVRYEVPDVEKIQNQVAHLNYGRPRGDDNAKLSYWDAHLAKESFDRAVTLFESKLNDDAKRYWRKREPKKLPASFIPRTTHSSHHTSILFVPGSGWSKQESDN